ncbi:MAG: hypothetical protein EXR70_02280 [Deltaproteobacteria bacterium]|nr:hypothetical protein [Deltaproteobacteria bacterium]
MVADALVQNNLILNSSLTGITAAPQTANRRVRNVTIVSNTVVGHPKCLDLRWEGAENMVLANNAFYCAGGVSVDALGLNGSGVTVRANVVEGTLVGVHLDGQKFRGGGRAGNTFKSSDSFDLWPRANSALLGAGDVKFAPRDDFNGRPRAAAKVDIGAYEAKGQSDNPGWKIAPGFKPLNGQNK